MKTMLLAVLFAFVSTGALCADNAISLALKDHKFCAAEIHVKANTPTTVNLYFAELKVFRIGDSPAAPNWMLCTVATSLRSSSAPIRVMPTEIVIPGCQTFWEEIHTDE